jgi:hypothetical protein
VKKLAAILVSLTGLAITVDGYQPLSKRGYPSLYAFGFGVFASELPLQMLAGQFALLAAITRRLSPRLRRFSWLVSALSWLGLLGLNRLGHQANLPLTAALDAGLGTDRRTAAIGVMALAGGTGVARAQPEPNPPRVPPIIDQLITSTAILWVDPRDKGGHQPGWGRVGMYCENLFTRCR